MLKIVNLCVTDKEKKKFLFLRRNKPPFKDYYGMMGGKVKEGEDITEAASRELFEESEITSRGEYLGKCHEKIIENDSIIGEFDIHFFHFIIDEDTTHPPKYTLAYGVTPIAIDRSLYLEFKSDKPIHITAIRLNNSVFYAIGTKVIPLR